MDIILKHQPGICFYISGNRISTTGRWDIILKNIKRLKMKKNKEEKSYEKDDKE